MVSWSIVISEESFKEYTSNGNRFYFCGNRDWWDVPCMPGMSFPHDKYAYSLIVVEVTPENKIASVTSRWNTYAGDTGDFLTEQELKSILGIDNYRRLFCESAENDKICNHIRNLRYERIQNIEDLGQRTGF